MARPAQQTRAALIEKLSHVFRDYGYDGASMSTLSEVSGLSKASLYHHFPGGKHEMASKVLGAEGLRLQQLVLAPLDNGEQSASRLIASIEGVGAFYNGSPPSCLMNSMLHGTGAALFGADIARVVNVWQQRYAAVYSALVDDDEEAAAWASYAIERIQGVLILCRVKSERQPLLDCLNELSGDILAANSD